MGYLFYRFVLTLLTNQLHARIPHGFIFHVFVKMNPPRFNDGSLRETENILLALGFCLERLKHRRRCGCSYTGLDERSTFHFVGLGGILVGEIWFLSMIL